MSTTEVLAAWHEYVDRRDPALLEALVAEDCVFRSPVVHTPQEGRALTVAYLTAALEVLGDDSFSYVHETLDDDRFVLEFTVDLDGTHVNGVDVVDVRDGRIVGFTVMIRPLRGIQEVHRRMAAMLERMADGNG